MKIIGDKEKIEKDKCASIVAQELFKLLKSDNSMLYYNFPIYRGDIDADIVKAQLMLISSKYGILYFTCLNERRNLSDKEIKSAEDLYANIYSRVSKDSLLRNGRDKLKIKINSCVIICNIEKYYSQEGDYIYSSIYNLDSVLSNNLLDKELDEEELRHLFSCVDCTKMLVPKKERKILDSDDKSKAFLLNEIQNSEAVFDYEQKQVAFVNIEGPQRVRGLAGSGKTIILTMKAAFYHLQYPEDEIVYTYYTKSLYGMIKNLIERYYRNFSDNHEPNWNKIHILHGWGGASLHGVYYQACLENGIRPINYSEAIGHSISPFDYVCSDILKQNINPVYDLTLIDEGQDFPVHFYQLCYRLSKNKKIVWAYDDFQNIFDVKIQDEKEMFGKNDKGEYYVDFSQMVHPYRDVVLHTCYRNPRNVLIYAFSLGLGVYNEKVLQRLSDNSQWESLGFKVENGDCSVVGSEMTISRPEENSPACLSSSYGYTVKIHTFDNLKSECKFVAKSIEDDIQKEKLRPDDICVICLDGKYIEDYFEILSSILLNHGIRSFNHINASYSNTEFIHEGYVTLSTLNKAKGNEAGMVYVMGVDRVFNNPNDVIERNRLFTAITRTKGWCILTGEKNIEQCIHEMQKLKEAKMKLCFKQPSEVSTKTIENVSKQNKDSLDELAKLVSKLEESGMPFDKIMKYAQGKYEK